MNIARVRGFLLQLPKPHMVRLTSGDGEPQELKPGRSYAKTAETIGALGPELIECLDSDGKLLRALRMTAADAQRSDAAEVPAGIAADPHALMLTHFANLLHRAYEHSTEIAFGKMVELADKMNDRSEAIEQRLERAEAQNRRLIVDQYEDALERVQEAAATAAAGGENGELLGNQLLGAFLSGKASPPPKRTNGAATNGVKGHE